MKPSVSGTGVGNPLAFSAQLILDTLQGPRVWNAAGEESHGIHDLQTTDASPIWVGNWAMPQKEEQGLQVLEAP